MGKLVKAILIVQVGVIAFLASFLVALFFKHGQPLLAWTIVASISMLTIGVALEIRR